MLLRDVSILLLAYLIGSIPFAHLITRWRTGLSIHEVGEGNVGARNVWHVVSPGWGAFAGLMDSLKGTGAVLLAWLLGSSLIGAILAGPAAILGHAFPAFLRFHGGKGVATTIGVALAWTPWSTLTGLAVFGAAQLLWRDFNRSVVAGVAAIIFLPPVFGYPWPMMVYFLLLFSSLALKKRLDMGHERRVWAASGWQDDSHPGWYDESTAGLPEGTEVHKHG